MTCTCPKAQARKLRVLAHKVRSLECAVNWLYFGLGVGTAFVVAVGCCLAAIKLLRDLEGYTRELGLLEKWETLE